jgi:hypothetical protein
MEVKDDIPKMGAIYDGFVIRNIICCLFAKPAAHWIDAYPFAGA